MQITKTDILSTAILILLSAYMVLGKNELLNVTIYEVIFLLLGFGFSLVSFIFIENFWTKVGIFVSTLAIYYFHGNDAYLLSIFLIGLNISALYFQTKLQDKEIFNFSFINTLFIAGIIFQNAVSKFRGFNKIDPLIANNTVLISATSVLVMALLLAGLKHLIKLKKLPTFYENTLFVLAGLSAIAFNYLYFLELGLDTLLLPMISGAFIAYSSVLLDRNSKLFKAATATLILMTSYRVSGNAGIALSLLSALFLIETATAIIQKKKMTTSEIVLQISPLIFLFAITEIRENQGLITRLNLTSGYQIGWILLGTILLNYFFDILKKVKKFMLDNEILGLSPLITTVFTAMLFTLIIKYGKEEGLTSLLIATVVYLISLNNLDYRRYKSRVRFLLAAANVLGVLSFLVLTKL